jgi:hypothetical protein
VGHASALTRALFVSGPGPALKYTFFLVGRESLLGMFNPAMVAIICELQKIAVAVASLSWQSLSPGTWPCPLPPGVIAYHCKYLTCLFVALYKLSLSRALFISGPRDLLTLKPVMSNLTHPVTPWVIHSQPIKPSTFKMDRGN